jgi:hypothetical protein
VARGRACRGPDRVEGQIFGVGGCARREIGPSGIEDAAKANGMRLQPEAAADGGKELGGGKD